MGEGGRDTRVGEIVGWILREIFGGGGERGERGDKSWRICGELRAYGGDFERIFHWKDQRVRNNLWEISKIDWLWWWLLERS